MLHNYLFIVVYTEGELKPHHDYTATHMSPFGLPMVIDSFSSPPTPRSSRGDLGVLIVEFSFWASLPSVVMLPSLIDTGTTVYTGKNESYLITTNTKWKQGSSSYQ